MVATEQHRIRLNPSQNRGKMIRRKRGRKIDFTPNTKGEEIRAKSNVRITKSLSLHVMYYQGFVEKRTQVA